MVFATKLVAGALSYRAFETDTLETDQGKPFVRRDASLYARISGYDFGGKVY
jgi:hypothetical protein